MSKIVSPFTSPEIEDGDTDTVLHLYDTDGTTELAYNDNNNTRSRFNATSIPGDGKKSMKSLQSTIID